MKDKINVWTTPLTRLAAAMVGSGVASAMMACGGAHDSANVDVDKSGSKQSAIRGAGTILVPDGQYGTVVRAADDVGGSCSATIIADDAVISAGHCFCRGNTARDPCNDVAWVRIWFGADWRSEVISGRSIVHPNWVDGEDDEYDLAIILLDEPISAYTNDHRLKSKGLRTSNLRLGETMTVVGFGGSGSNCQTFDRRKRRNTDWIDALNRTSFLLDRRVTCDGDSGGAAFDDRGRLAGVVKGGARNIFQGDRTKLIRVDRNIFWIQEAMTRCGLPGRGCTTGADCCGACNCVFGCFPGGPNVKACQ